MNKYIPVPADLYILKTDLQRLDNGEAVTGFIRVTNPAEYELVTKYAFLPAIQLNENEFSVCTITE